MKESVAFIGGMLLYIAGWIGGTYELTWTSGLWAFAAALAGWHLLAVARSMEKMEQ